MKNNQIRQRVNPSNPVFLFFAPSHLQNRNQHKNLLPNRPPHTLVHMNEAFMRQAIDLSIEKMMAGKGGPFGAVIVKDNQPVGHGWNCVTSTNDPTAHAEIMAIRDACKHLNTFDLTGCTIYASWEPCPMCLAAIYWARIDTLYFAADRNDAASAGFDDEFLYQEISKPSTNRQLAARRILPDEARIAFRLWQEKKDRTEY